jgi:hypothetical protein
MSGEPSIDLGRLEQAIAESDRNGNGNEKRTPDLDEASTPRGERGDLVPNPLDVVHRRINTLATDVTEQGLSQLGQMRDELDGLMHSITESHEGIVHSLQEHTKKVAKVIKAKTLMASALAELREDFPPPPRVVTATRK